MYQCVVGAFVHSGGLEGLFGFRCRSVPPIQAWTSPSSPLSLLSPSRLFLDFHSRRRKKIFTNLCIFLFLFFFRSATPLEGIEGMCVRLSSSLSPDLFLICASFKLPLLAAAFPRYIPASLLRVMLWMESNGLLTPACSYQRLAVSIPISFPAYDPLSPLSPLLQL